MELTDDIRKKRFSSPLDSHMLKTANEYTCLAALKYFYNEKYKHLKHSDAPDLQDVVNNIAIEITDSITPQDAQTIGEFSRLIHTGNEKVKVKCRQKITANGAKLQGDGFMIWKPRSDTDEKEALVQAIQCKLKKINDYHQKGFRKLGLMIYHERPLLMLTKENIESFFIEMQKEHKEKFDFIYVLSIYELLYYNCITKEKELFEISSEDRRSFGNIGRMAAEGEIKDDDPIWK